MMPPHLTQTPHGYRADATIGRVIRSGFGRTPGEAVQALRLACGLPPVGPDADRLRVRRFVSAWGREREPEEPMRDALNVVRWLSDRGLLEAAEWRFGCATTWAEADREAIRSWARGARVAVPLAAK